ncbi:MAG: helix-turn-helix domain-containing protein [Halioglobus sp.]
MLSVSGAFFSVVAEWLQQSGYGQSRLCQRILRLKSDSILSIEQAETYLSEAVTISGRNMAALEIGGMVKRRHLGPIGHMLASSKTLEEMLNAYVYYERLFYGSNIANVRRNEEGIELYWAIENVPVQYARFAMSSFASIVEQLGLARHTISSVAFPFHDEENHDLYLHNLKCDKVVFGRDLGIQFSNSSLQLSIEFEEERAATTLILRELMPELDDYEFAARLYDQIVSALPKREAKLKIIASNMAMSGRTLQRKVSACDDGLRGIIHRVRMHLAKEYLKDTNMNLLAVSLLLGYSEQSALQLAFKRFYGVSPGKWRKNYEEKENKEKG